MSDEADRLNEACPTCWHAMAVHDAEGCSVCRRKPPGHRCLQPFDPEE